jgi:hypothetical protein
MVGIEWEAFGYNDISKNKHIKSLATTGSRNPTNQETTNCIIAIKFVWGVPEEIHRIRKVSEYEQYSDGELHCEVYL